MLVWVREHDDMYSAELAVEQHHKVHLLVEELGDTSWDWHVWDAGGRLQQRYGLADGAAQAEAALGQMLVEMNRRNVS